MRYSSLKKEIRETLFLAIPMAAAQLAQVSLNFTDIMMVGRLNSESLAAIGLAGALYYPVLVIAMGIVMAVGPMVSQAFGAGNHEAVERSVRQGLWLSAALTVPCWIVLYFLPSLLPMLGQQESVVPLATDYLHSVMWSLLPALWFVASKNFLDGLSRPRVALVITLSGVVINIGANYVLMFGKLGFPALGVAGTGWATTIVNSWMFLMMAWYIRKSKSMRKYNIFNRIRRPDMHYFRELFRIGWPIGTAFFIEVVLFAITALWIGELGTDQLAGHQVAINLASVTFMLAVGVALATTVRVGHATGRGDLAGARRAGYSGMVVGTVFMSVTGLLFLLIPRFFVSIYMDTGKPENLPVIDVAVRLLAVAAAFQVFDALQVTAAGALRGLKDTWAPMVVGFFAYWCIGLTSAWWFGFHLGGREVGLWWGLVLGLAVASVLLTLRYRYHFLHPVRLQRLANRTGASVNEHVEVGTTRTSDPN